MYHSRTLRIRPASFTATRAFHQSCARLIKAGDAFPDITVMEDSPGNKLSLAQVLKKQPQALVIGVPAGLSHSTCHISYSRAEDGVAFSPACSSTHIPGYVAAKSGIPSYVVSVNDPFVMKVRALH
jgi:2-Cys peroxiredoxin 5